MAHRKNTLTWSCSRLPACLSLLLAACGTPATPLEQAARLQSPSPQCHAQITQLLTGFMQAPVVLASDVFAHDGMLSLEKAAPRDATGGRLNGRVPDRPARFRLLTDGRRCLLRGEQPAHRAVLSHCDCRTRAVP
jgi:hypothetical protein